MKINISLAAARYTSDLELLPLLFKWVHGSAKTRASVTDALLKCKIDPRYQVSGAMFRQIWLPQRVMEQVNDPKAKDSTVVLELHQTPFSSWTKREGFARGFVSEKNSTTQSMAIIKRTVKKTECLIYLPNFVKHNSLTHDDYKAVAKSRTPVFLARMSLAGEAEALVFNNAKNTKITKGMIVHLFHATTKFTGLSRKIKAAYPEVKIARRNTTLDISARAGSRSISLTVQEDGLSGKALRSGTTARTSPTYPLIYKGQITFEVVDDLLSWVYAKTATPPKYQATKEQETVRKNQEPSRLSILRQNRIAAKKPKPVRRKV